MALGALAGVAACEELRWHHPTLPEERWETDRQLCAASSYADARQRYDETYLTREAHRAGVDGDMARMRQTELRNRQMSHQQSAFERCMTDKGYMRIARPPT